MNKSRRILGSEQGAEVNNDKDADNMILNMYQEELKINIAEDVQMPIINELKVQEQMFEEQTPMFI